MASGSKGWTQGANYYLQAIFSNMDTQYNCKFPHWACYPNNWNNGTPLASEFGVRERFIRWYAKHKPRPREINLSATKGGMGGNEI